MTKTPGGPARQGRRRRRVDAPATNPDADPSDDVTTVADDDDEHRGHGARGARGARPAADPRDTWIAEQRPPHWD